MLINVRTEKTYNKVIDSKITRDGNYTDTLAFKIPLETDIRIEDVIQVISPKVKEKYRVREIVNKQDYKDVFCKHVFFDSEKIVIDNFSNQGRDNNLESLVRFLNDKLNSKRFSGNSFKFNTNTNVGGVVNYTQAVTLFDMIFKEKGIIDTYNCEVQYHDWNVTFVDSLPSNNTEILFHEKKNITELSNLIEAKDLTTKLYVTCTYKENKDSKSRKDASYYLEKFNQREQKIAESQRLADNERTQRRQEYLDNYSKPKGKRTREQIHADYLARLEQQDAQREQRREEARQRRLASFESLQKARENKQLSRENEGTQETIINYIHTSPLISQYPRVLESIVNIQSDEINTLDSLIAYCEENFFTENDRRDVPRTTYTFKPVVDNYDVNLKDIALVVYEKLKIRKIVSCIKYEYDPQNDKFYTTEFGDWKKPTLKGSSVDEKISLNRELITNDIMDSVNRMYYEDYLKKVEYESELFDKEFDSQWEIVENNISTAIENNLKEAEDFKTEINQKIENNKAEISTEVNSAKTEALEHAKAYTDNFNATIRNEVNEIQNNIVSFDSRLNDSVREFSTFRLNYGKDLALLGSNLTVTNAKIDNAKNELSSQINNLNEWKTTATGNISKIGNIENTVNTSIARLNSVENTARESTQKIQELLQYKNNDNQRKEELKTYFESKTAEKLTTERNNIIRLVDNRGYATTTSVNNTVNEKVNEFSRQISSVNTKIADLKVGGRNLLKGTKDFSGEWDLSSWLDANETYQNLKVKRTDRGWNGITQNVFVNKGDVLTFSFYAKATSQIDVKLATLYSGSSVFKPPLAEIKEQETVYKTIGTDWARYDRLITVTKSGSLQCRVEYDGEWIGHGIWLFICGFKLEKGNIPTDWIQAPEDTETYIDSKINQKANEIDARVVSVEQNAVKYQDININTDNIQIGASKIIDGDKLASLITVSPSAVSTITDKFIITSSNENLVDIDKRNVVISNNRDTLLSRDFTDDLYNGEEFLIKGRFRKTINGANPDFQFMVVVWFFDGTRYFPMKPILLNNGIPLKNRGVNEVVDVEYTFKLELPNNKKIIRWSIALQQEGWNNFATWEVLNLIVQRKKDAKLIVDGSITADKIATNSITTAHLKSDIIDARHIKARVITGNLIDVRTIRAENIAVNSINASHISAGSIETGHLKAGIIEAKHIKTNSIEAQHIVIDEAMVNKLVTNEILVRKLIAQNAFISKLNTITISATQITSGYLSANRISGGTISGVDISGVTIKGNSKIKIGEYGFMQPADYTLQINVPAYKNSTYGVGLQIAGRKDGYVPKGLFIYNDPNFSQGTTIGNSINDVLLTVKGKVSLCNTFNGKVIQGCPIISNFDENYPVYGYYRISFIGYHGKKNCIYITEGNETNSEWWLRPDSSASDIKLKNNIIDSHHSALDVINQFYFKEFDWITDKFGYTKPHTKIGLIAQDVQKIDKTLVDDLGGTLHLDDFRLLNINLKATQELSQKIIQLEKEIQQLRLRLSEVG